MWRHSDQQFIIRDHQVLVHYLMTVVVLTTKRKYTNTQVNRLLSSFVEMLM